MEVTFKSLFSLGIGAAAIALLIPLINITRPGITRVRQPPKKKIKIESRSINRKNLVLSFAGMIFGASIAWGTAYWPFAAAFFTATGLLIEPVTKKLYAKTHVFKKMREVAILYETVDLLTRANFTIRQSLQMALPLLNVIRPSVEKCIDRYNVGPERALSELGSAIGLKEADILVSALMTAESLGTEKMTGVLEEGANRLEDLRNALAEARVAGRPIYMTVYVFLPLTSLIGMAVAPLAYRAILMISNMRSPG